MGKITSIAYHRNGVAGAPFYVILFKFHDPDGRPSRIRNMQAVVFPEEDGYCAVLDADETAKGNIGFGMGNSWRGDDFEPWLRQQIAKYKRER